MKSTYELINEFRNEMNCRFDKIENEFVRNDRFNPVERLVYGMVGVILLAFVGAMVALVINKTGVNAKW